MLLPHFLDIALSGLFSFIESSLFFVGLGLKCLHAVKLGLQCFYLSLVLLILSLNSPESSVSSGPQTFLFSLFCILFFLYVALLQSGFELFLVVLDDLLQLVERELGSCDISEAVKVLLFHSHPFCLLILFFL